MKTCDFYYDLPEGLIAQHPAEPRDSGRMLVCNRENGRLAHRAFRDFPSYLRARDVLVLNRTRVIPARLLGEKEGSGIPIEVLLLRRQSADVWEALVKPGRRMRQGARLVFGGGALRAEVEETTPAGSCMVRFFYDGVFEALLDSLGQMPLPPYIHEKLKDKSQYQTVYAQQDGSAAAPTAGLHFTQEILQAVERRGVNVVDVLLHVGLGTFRPVKTPDIDSHVMHSEYYEVTEAAARRINDARARGGRVFCVGTTSVRTLETCAGDSGQVSAGRGMTDIFIKPGYRFKATDALLTNFHLPGSTLLMLVSAMMGRENALAAYRAAVAASYRFFSFGDCMLIGSEFVPG